MNIPLYARYNYCYKKACEFLEEYEINSYPIEPLQIIANNHYGIMPYSEFMNEHNCDLDTVCRCMQSNDGKTILTDGVYSIAYNDLQNSQGRIRFTLMHEIGHIYLNHLIDFENTELSQCGLSKAENTILENEANAFARNVLAPVSMINQLKDKSVKNISSRFGLTPSAAKTRISFLQQDNKFYIESGMLYRMQNIFRSFFYKKKCPICNFETIQQYGKHCTICGSTNLYWGDGDKMKYPLLNTYENGKLCDCPKCKNEVTNLEGNYCQICGTYLINECPSCQTQLPSNARYCNMCGNHSTFFTSSILKPWDYNENNVSLPYEEEEFPFSPGTDIELPFQ